MPLLRYIIAPLLIFGVACLLVWETASRFPAYFAVAVGLCIAVLLVLAHRQEKRDVRRGWRVGHAGRDSMYYEELRDGEWRRIRIDGEMLTGKAHHVIYFASVAFPDWARDRREEIVSRIKSEFHPPGYEYSDA